MLPFISPLCVCVFFSVFSFFSFIFFFFFFFFIISVVRGVDVISFHGELKVLEEHGKGRLFISLADGTPSPRAFLPLEGV